MGVKTGFVSRARLGVGSLTESKTLGSSLGWGREDFLGGGWKFLPFFLLPVVSFVSSVFLLSLCPAPADPPFPLSGSQGAGLCLADSAPCSYSLVSHSNQERKLAQDIASHFTDKGAKAGMCVTENERHIPGLLLPVWAFTVIAQPRGERRGKQHRSLGSEDSGFHQGWATDWPLSDLRQVLTHWALGSFHTTWGRVVHLVGRVGGCLPGKLGIGTLAEANHRCVTVPGSLPHWGQ